MKTRNIIAAMIIGACVLGATNAFSQEFPAIKIYPSGDNLKVVFGYKSNSHVKVEFFDAENVFASDKIDAAKLETGFSRKYQLKRDHNEAFWVDVKNNELSARFKIKSSPKGQWVSTLETVTYNPIAAR